jgi:hypothetical protein
MIALKSMIEAKRLAARPRSMGFVLSAAMHLIFMAGKKMDVGVGGLQMYCPISRKWKPMKEAQMSIIDNLIILNS